MYWKHLNCRLLLFVLFAWPQSLRGQASIEGNVTLRRPHTAVAATSRYPGTPSGATIASPPPPLAVVYLEGKFPMMTTNAPVARMGQKGAQFDPSILPVRTGTVVEFPNLDDFYHNVFSYSKPKSFDLGRYRKDEKPPGQLFDKPGVVRLNCEIHPHMRAVILVLDSPHFTTTDTNGFFHLTNLPAGRFVLKAWLDEKQVLEQPVELRDSDRLHVDFPGQAGPN